ncbi:RIP metalloprotease [Rhodococcus rhodnii]|uniref:Zinc metalloprotease Rip1 n=2 Tax=Rhodococcus rhodnii TaxID=38312 RepID=R7WPS0_9NOCA|nr:site-2 protease family protein [Rhodococcus rhodnii]EOM76009.1 membrane-associated Zn-dependent protease [Rhodococcus rhodnii LMG 5362]TXG90848.1 RIP metalloprotease [Rhodococcus rhodnii]
MVFALGVLLFALGIAISIALHEAGHMWTAKALGMKVRRYFIGFGPRIFSFRRGETEYGLKAIPAGGFCDIAGMTALDELAPDEVDRAMYKQKTWKRLVVMVGGIAMNFLLGIVLIWVLAVGWGLPNRDHSGLITETPCVAATQGGPPEYALAPCEGAGPAGAAGIRPGDTIVAVGGTETPEWSDVVRETQESAGLTDYRIEREGQELTLPVDVQEVERYVVDGAGQQPRLETVGAIGAAGPPAMLDYNALSAVPATFVYTGDIFKATFQALITLPSKAVDLWHAIAGGERGLDTPVSVVGASVIGGQAAERGEIAMFISLLASLNFFLGAFNILPLLPLDGGHMAVAIYERIRNWLREKRGKPIGGPVDYTKLLPVTYVFVVVGGAFMLLTLTADIVNPIKIFP